MRLCSLFLFIFCSFKGLSQPKDTTITYPLVLKFNSICCGVPSDLPLKKEIKTFKKKYKIKSITAFKISPMGKEGEYWLGFSLKSIPSKRRNLFTQNICALTKKMTDRGNASCEKDLSIVKSSLPNNTKFEKIIF